MGRRIAVKGAAKKRAYHHGDLERALVEAAVGMIREEGVRAFTLRNVGARVGVSRTALYRHFDDKAALLARVASEGFFRLHAALAKALATASQQRADPLQAMAVAYVHFAADNPSHYETMFGGFLTDWSRSPDLIAHADAAFNILADTIRGEQEAGKIGPGDPIELAEIMWSLSHGIATLGMARHLARTPRSVEDLAVMGCRFLEDGMRGVGRNRSVRIGAPNRSAVKRRENRRRLSRR
jgi:AcrR family transcriptional regulator